MIYDIAGWLFWAAVVSGLAVWAAVGVLEIRDRFHK